MVPNVTASAVIASAVADSRLLSSFAVCPCPGALPTWNTFFPEQLQQWQHALEDLLVTRCHHREGARAGAGHPTADGGVENVDASVSEVTGDLGGDGRTGRGQVDIRAHPSAVDQAALAERDRQNDLRPRKRDEDDVREVRHLERQRADDGTTRGGGLGGPRVDVEHGELVTSVEKRLGERRADRTEPHETDRRPTAHAPGSSSAAAESSSSTRRIASSATRKASIAAGTPQ